LTVVVAACPACGCTHAQNIATHAVRTALVEDDLDRALTLGLLDVTTCEGCDDACTMALLGARAARVRALAARDRFRTREARLERRRQERADRRSSMAASGNRTSTSPLPSAAAAALARAKAKAAAPR
jgi:Na+-translocating ferredoxin:NAD+ oxidoreductase RnfC subunit